MKSPEKPPMKQLTVGIMAHVDSGKTSLAEALLLRAGEIRQRGRVDRGDSMLDTDAMERARGITIFAHQAAFDLTDDIRVTLLDTPGHVDFSAETERTMQVLDYAVLVTSGTDGVQSHTRTLWNLLRRYNVPAVVFVNKMDISQHTALSLMQELRAKLKTSDLVRFDGSREQRDEDAAACTESLMESYLADGSLDDARLAEAVTRREIFPVCFGSARTMDGLDSLLAILRNFCPVPKRPENFAARVFKISVDAKGSRLTYLKVLGGELLNRQEIAYTSTDGTSYNEKITGIRFYTGAKFIAGEKAEPGAVCAVTGLSAASAGMGLGDAPPAGDAALTPVMRYRVQLPEGIDPVQALAQFRILEAEEPQLNVLWDEHSRAIYVQLMGAVQLEILSAQMQARFGYTPAFDSGMVTYRETIRNVVEGVGHYEPLRHYAEVHLLLSPLPAGSGLQFETRCPEDALDRNWQRLILTHLQEKTHIGVLTGSPVTDIKFTLMSGRSHPKHTEGGDFRQATYRAVRMALRNAESVLLEPCYDFTLEVPAGCVGRAMADLQQRGAVFAPPETNEETAVFTGNVPAAAMGDYAAEVLGYTKGQGVLSLSAGGYKECREPETVIQNIAYDPDSDTENSADSIFCSHGAGFLVNWQDVPSYMHLPSVFSQESRAEEEEIHIPAARTMPTTGDDELMAIFERTYGKIKRDERKAMRRDKSEEYQLEKNTKPVSAVPKHEYLLVDGYNVIFSWDSLKALAGESLDIARSRLIDRLQNYQGFRGCTVILVFDAYRIKGHTQEIVQAGNISIVYTKEAETADTYIERTSKQLIRDARVRVVTSDRQEQIIILGNGAVRISAREFELEIQAAEQEIRRIIGGN